MELQLPPGLRVRKAVYTDWPVLGRLAYQTAYFGLEATPFFPDQALFEDLWVYPYRLSPHDAFVGEQTGAGGVPLGYIIGAPDHRAYQNAFVATLLARIGPKLLTGRYQRFLGTLSYAFQVTRWPAPHADWDQYPAHLHINLLPGSRGAGLGSALLHAYLDALRARGVPGVQLSTTLENAAALKLYHRAGFTVAAQRSTELWTPWLGRPTVLVALARQL